MEVGKPLTYYLVWTNEEPEMINEIIHSYDLINWNHFTNVLISKTNVAWYKIQTTNKCEFFRVGYL